MDHDFTFWLGDLNYRVDETLSTDEVFQKVNAGEIETLRAHDQLNIERFNNNVFQGFEEGVLEVRRCESPSRCQLCRCF